MRRYAQLLAFRLGPMLYFAFARGLCEVGTYHMNVTREPDQFIWNGGLLFFRYRFVVSYYFPEIRKLDDALQQNVRVELVLLIGGDLPARLNSLEATSHIVFVLCSHQLEFQYKWSSSSMLLCVRERLRVDYVD